MAVSKNDLSQPVLLLGDAQLKRRELVGKFLRKIGFQVLFVDHSEQVIDKAIEHCADIVLLKTNLPGSGGIEVCRAMKHHTPTHSIPVFLVADQFDEAEMEQARTAGAIDYLTGPAIQWSMLKGRICYLLRTQQRKQELELLAKVFEATNEGIMITDAKQNIIKVNRGFCRSTGYPMSEVIGKTPRILQSGKQDREFYQAMWDSVHRTGQWEGVIWNRRKDGSIYAEWINISVVTNDADAVIHYVGIFSDITQMQSEYEQMSHLAYHDPLTGLANRALFFERLNQAIVTAARSGDQLAVMFVDVDRFKQVNDQLGHKVGDDLLIHVAGVLKKCVRQSDTVARLGGDEFVVLLTLLKNKQDIVRVAEKMTALLQQNVEIDGHTLSNSASIGVSMFPKDSQDGGTLVEHADYAMYKAKHHLAHNYAFYADLEIGGESPKANRVRHIARGK